MRRSPTTPAWPFIVVILTQMAVGAFSLYTLSAIRAFVTGESLWSKGQHEAVYFFDLYLEGGKPQDLANFKRTLAVPLAYREGRQALERMPPDPEVTRRTFVEAGTSADDIPSVIWMLRNFRGFPPLEDAIARWREADVYILELERLGQALDGEPSAARINAVRTRVEAIDAEITPRAVAFSRALDDGARVVEHLLLAANIVLAGILATLTIWRVVKLQRQREAFEDALAWQASHDDLTGLSNRRAFARRLAEIVEPVKGKLRASFALIFIDLDQFKIVNDTCGHAAGDALLQRICPSLQHLLGPDDLLARLGGDEFSILLPRADLARALQVSESVRVAVEQIEFAWGNRVFGVTASVGVAHDEAAVVSAEEMMSKADLACFMAKEKGRNRVHLHHDEDQELLDRMREMNWVQRIHEALNEDRFTLYAQEIVALREVGDPGIHLEVLVRMHDETGALIPPSNFLPAAERFGLIKLVDRWVVRRAFQIMADRRHVKNRLPITCCAINLSGATFGDAAFLDFLKDAFAEYNVSPATICFEVTETSAIVNLVAARDFVHELRALGCTFALDDFGSGMSSFNYLKELPVDYLKIDGAFVKNLLDDRPDRAMVEMICHVGHIMGKRIVAEFVETKLLADALREIGVDYGQGYGIAPPRLFDAYFEGAATVAALAPKPRERLSA